PPPGRSPRILRQARSDDLLHEPLQLFGRQSRRAKLQLELALHLLQSVPAVQKPEQKLLALVEAVIAERDRVFDDVALAALVALHRSLKIAAQDNADLIAAFALFQSFHGLLLSGRRWESPWSRWCRAAGCRWGWPAPPRCGLAGCSNR